MRRQKTVKHNLGMNIVLEITQRGPYIMSSRNGSEKKKKVEKMVQEIRVYAPAELKELVGLAGDNHDPPLPMSEFVVRVLADYFGRPDLRNIPRKRSGAPRKQKVT
jgi:hypothetical protein